MAVTRRFVIVVLVGVVAAVVLPSLVTVLVWNGAVIVAAVVDWVLAPRVRDLQLSRRGRQTTRLGEPVECELTVANPTARRVHGVIRDAWPPSAGVQAPRRAIDVPAGERRRLTFTLVPTRRGVRTPERVSVRALGPLGLVARQGSHAVPWRIDVLPPFTSRKHLPSRLARLRDLDGRTAVLVRGQGTEFDSLREYVVGDDVRSIDWRASARAADVMVRTWRPERDRRVLLVLDTGRTSAGRVGDAPRLDAAMEAALLLAALASRGGDRVDFLSWDRQVRASVSGESGGQLLESMTRAMAALEPALVETDYRGLVGEISRRSRQRMLVVLLTALEPAAIEEGLLPVLPTLATRHQVVLASVADPAVAEMAAGRGDLESVYAAAAAESAGASRRRVAAVLRRAHVQVVDVPPDRLPPALADSYLALKKAGRL